MKSNFKKAITGIGLNGSYQLITIIIGIIQVPIIISVYGNEGYGFFISFTIFNLLGYFAFADIGLPLFLQKDYFKLQNKKIGKFVVAATSLILLISSLLLVGVLFLLKDTIFAVYENKIDTIGLTLLFFFYPLGFQNLIFDSVLRGKLDYINSNLAQFFGEISRFLLLIFFVITEVDLGLLALTIPFGWVIQFFWLYYKCHNLLDYRGALRGVSYLKRNSKIIGQLYIGRVSSIVYNSSDKIIILYLGSPALLTVYDVLSKFPLFLNKIYGLSTSTLIPLGATLKTRSDLIIIFKRVYKLLSYSFIPIIISLIFNFYVILNIWLKGQVIIESWKVIVILIWAFSTVFLSFGNLLIGANLFIREITYFRISQAFLRVFIGFILFYLGGFNAFLMMFLVIAMFNFSFLIYFLKSFGESMLVLLDFKLIKVTFLSIMILILVHEFISFNNYLMLLVSNLILLVVFLPGLLKRAKAISKIHK